MIACRHRDHGPVRGLDRLCRSRHCRGDLNLGEMGHCLPFLLQRDLHVLKSPVLHLLHLDQPATTQNSGGIEPEHT